MEFKKELGAYAVGRRANQEEWNTITRVATGKIGFGVPVTDDSGVENGCKATIADGDNIIGITEASQVLPHEGDEYIAKDNVAVCEFGVIGVVAGGTVTKGTQAEWDTTNGWVQGGDSDDIFTIPGAEYETGGSKNDIVLIRYRRPVQSLAAKTNTGD